MRALYALLLPALLLAPALAAAETAHLRAGGATLGLGGGVAGIQTGPTDAFGIRYWVNGTEDDSATFILTTCYTTGSRSVEYCERTRVTL